MSKRAIILAGGQGTRLRPYTVVLPKPLMPLGEYPILEIIIKQLARYDYKHITLAVNHQAELIKSFCNDGSKWNVKIDYSLEDKPLGTMAPLKLINDLPENFLVMNGDVLTNLDFNAFYNLHISQKNLITIAAHQRMQKIDFGVLEVNTNQELINFQEKPENNYLVSMGIYSLNNSILKYIPDNEYFGFDHLMYALLNAKKKVFVKGYSNYWLDIGRPDDYKKAIHEFENEKTLFL